LLYQLLKKHLSADARITVTSSGTHDPLQKSGNCSLLSPLSSLSPRSLSPLLSPSLLAPLLSPRSLTPSPSSLLILFPGLPDPIYNTAEELAHPPADSVCFVFYYFYFLFFNHPKIISLLSRFLIANYRNQMDIGDMPLPNYVMCCLLTSLRESYEMLEV
jgi:hypothetical protein